MCGVNADTHSGKQPTIDTSLDQQRSLRYQENLDTIIKCILLCGQQNIPLRGHRDSNLQQPSNKGNFKAFRALGDPLLKKHLTEGPRNHNIYTSPEIQNEIISICKFPIWENIVASINECKFYTIICDECTDISNKEQLYLSVRFVAKGTVNEAFLGFFELDEGVTGEAIATKIHTALSTCHLDPNNMRGQSYDGASNMSGCYKGCAKIIEQLATAVLMCSI